LKIEADGDFWKGLIKPKIRLMGRWLEQAGFRPGNRVHVTCIAPGVIELRSLDAIAKPSSLEQRDRSP
jgi:type I toxin-antitoxin system toxin SymE